MSLGKHAAPSTETSDQNKRLKNWFAGRVGNEARRVLTTLCLQNTRDDKAKLVARESEEERKPANPRRRNRRTAEEPL